MTLTAPLSASELYPVPAPAAPYSPRASLPMTEGGFCDWLASAKPGNKVEYCRGHLAYDRCPSVKTHSERDRKRLVALAKRVWQAAEDGCILPCQRRHGDGDYSYFAIKATPQLRRERLI